MQNPLAVATFDIAPMNEICSPLEHLFFGKLGAADGFRVLVDNVDQRAARFRATRYSEVPGSAVIFFDEHHNHPGIQYELLVASSPEFSIRNDST